MGKIGDLYRLILSTLFMALANFLVYFGFTNQYSSTTFNLKNFDQQYNSGVYQFRFLSTQAIELLYKDLAATKIDFATMKLHFLQADSDPVFFVTLFIYNTFFAAIAIILFNVFLNGKKIDASPSEKLLLSLVVASLIAITQFVIVPYDTFSYAILIGFAIIFVHYMRRKNMVVNFILLCLLLVIGTLNRESMALALAFAASIMVTEKGIDKSSILNIGALTIVFIVTYILLRMIYQTPSTTDGLLLAENFSNPKNILAFCFWIVLGLIPFGISKSHDSHKMLVLFYLFSTPYIIFCLATGILFEVRLIIPIFILALLLSKLNLNKSSFQYS